MIKVLIADDHQLFRDGIKSLLRPYGKIKIIGEAVDGIELQEKYFELLPSVVLSDISMPIRSGIKSAEAILEIDPAAKFLFLTMHEEDEYIFYANKVGGRGLVTKNSIKDELVDAILNIYDGKKYFLNKSESELTKIFNKYENESLAGAEISLENLTEKETQVLKLVGEGYTSNEIARIMEISRRTVDTHRHNIMSKLNIKSLPEFLKFAIRHNFQNDF